MAEWPDLSGMDTVDAVYAVLQQARADGDVDLADAARRRLQELMPDNPRSVRPRHADHQVPLRRRMVQALLSGIAFAGAFVVIAALIGFGTAWLPVAGAGFVIGVAVLLIASEPNRTHHPDAGAESIMNYVRGEGP